LEKRLLVPSTVSRAPAIGIRYNFKASNIPMRKHNKIANKIMVFFPGFELLNFKPKKLKEKVSGLSARLFISSGLILKYKNSTVIQRLQEQRDSFSKEFCSC
jgi:hypothetical protein